MREGNDLNFEHVEFEEATSRLNGDVQRHLDSTDVKYFTLAWQGSLCCNYSVYPL